MPPKRRGAQARAAAQATRPPPDPPKPARPTKTVSAPPPPPPVESDAAKVRKEWSKFIDAWYEPQKKKLVEKLQRDLLVKYKHLGSAKDTQKLREMELFEKLDSIAQQLAQPARAEWERRLKLAQLREDEWDDMSGEEQQAVMSVFVGFFTDDVDDLDDDDISTIPSSIEEDSVVEDPPYRGIPSYPPSAPPPPSRQPIPPTPTRGNFEFVNPTSFFSDTITPPNPTKNLPALSTDHLAALGPSNPARSAEPVSGGVGGMLGFQNWASEAGIVTQQPSGQPAKPPPPPPSASTSAQTLSARPRAMDNMSRQPSAASAMPSPPLKASSPQYSPPTKFSPSINAEGLPLGKRYIGPVITEEEPDPMDEQLLKSKMADDYQQYKISLRIQMIYQFHAEAADIEIKLFESLLAVEGTKESRARAVQEHETSMMRLREQKEEERKRLCAEEREKRREEVRQHLTQRRSSQNQEVDPPPKASPPVAWPDKTSVQQGAAKVPLSSKPKKTKGGWGSVASKPKVTSPVVEESESESAPAPPTVTPAWGKKTAQAAVATKPSLKPQLKVAISEESESEFECRPAPARTNKAKSAWDAPAMPSACTSMQAAKKATQQQAEPRCSATTPGFTSVRVGPVPDREDEYLETTVDDNTMPGALGFAESEEAEEGDASAWFNPENMNYWAEFLAGQPEAETQAVPEADEQTGKHVRWTPTVGGESDDEEAFGEADEHLATNMWMQYAISGGDIPSLGDTPEEPPVIPSEHAQRDASLWEQGKGKKKLNPTTGDFGNRAQQTSVFDRAAITGQWPKMESWLSPPSRGQNSGSTRVF